MCGLNVLERQAVNQLENTADFASISDTLGMDKTTPFPQTTKTFSSLTWIP